MSEPFDLVIIGGGIVGLSTARVFHRRRPDWTVGVLEKEEEVGLHQTGHSSGVVHSGVYYRPGSLKARLCLEGRAALIDFAERERIPVRTVGKLIVAGDDSELPRLEEFAHRASANGIDSVRRIGPRELKDRLPGVAGVGALDVPTAGIIDYPAVARRLRELLQKEGVVVETGLTVRSAAAGADGWRLEGNGKERRARFVVNCAGLQADLVAAAMGVRSPVAIVPFRGDFFHLSPRLKESIPCLVYPVPDPDLPFLGVHLTPTVDGGLLAGPNAALALSREGYRPGQWDLEQLARMALFPGTLGLARRYGRFAAREWMRSWSRGSYLEAIRTIWPDVRPDDLGVRSSGVRAQAVRADGSLEDDFVIVRGERALHVVNAPSPAATASFAIAERIADAAGVPRPLGEESSKGPTFI